MDSDPLKETSNFSEGIFEGEEKQSKTIKTQKIIIISAIATVSVIAIIAIILIFALNTDEDNKEDEPIKPRSLLDIEKLKKYETPYYYYNTSLLNETIAEALRLAKQHNLKIHFSLKSNFNEKIVRLFASHEEIGADCVSGGEVDYSLKFFPKEKIVFAGIGKTDKEIENAVDNGIFCLNVESYEELENLNEICKRKKKKMNFATRINPNIEAHTHEKIITGLNDNKFGIYLEEDENKYYNKIKEVYFNLNNKYEYLNFIGLHFHIGSNILNFTDFAVLCKKIDKIVDKLNDNNISITYLNLGGGLGVDYNETYLHPIPDFEGYFNTYLTNLTCLQKIGPNYNGNKNITLHFELGRSLIAQSGYVISKVNYVKEGIKKKFAILDAGMNDLIRPAMYDALHQIERVELNDEKEMYDVVGPICESSDVFAKNYTMDKLQKGDYVLIRTAGAYGESMASRYNFRDLIKGYLDYEF
jgi:diaminopimelate decarboxylase